MKKYLVIFALIVIIALPLSAQYGKTDGIGAGINLGYPVGATVRYGMDDFRFFGNLSWNFAQGFYLDGGALYDIAEIDVEGLPIFINGGALLGLGINNGFQISVHGVVGASYYLEDYPVELFLNLAPGYTLVGNTGFNFKGGLGGVWYF